MANSILSAPHFQNDAAAFEYVEAHLWPNGPSCPHCGNADVNRIGRLQGKTTRPGLRKCYACRKPFTVRIGSIFEDSHLALHLWLQVIHLMCASKKGISTRQIQRMLVCSMKTAWHLTHRIRAAMAPSNASPIGGDGRIIEADVTYVGRKDGTKVRRGAGHMRPVLTLVERDGRARSFHMTNVRGDNRYRVIAEYASKGSDLRTDEARSFIEIGEQFASHETVNHSKDEFARGGIHSNTVEGFFSILKRGIYGTYQNVSEAHLHRYLSEFDFRYGTRPKLGVNDSTRTGLAVKGGKGKRLTNETITP
jgi:transposase-like protein